MSYLLASLTDKEDVDKLILNTIDKVLVLRIGRASDVVCMQLDDIVRVFYSFELYAQYPSANAFPCIIVLRYPCAVVAWATGLVLLLIRKILGDREYLAGCNFTSS